jgi:hypothetical protein
MYDDGLLFSMSSCIASEEKVDEDDDDLYEDSTTPSMMLMLRCCAVEVRSLPWRAKSESFGSLPRWLAGSKFGGTSTYHRLLKGEVIRASHRCSILFG